MAGVEETVERAKNIGMKGKLGISLLYQQSARRHKTFQPGSEGVLSSMH